MAKLASILSLSAEEQEQFESGAERLSTISETLAEAVEKVKDSEALEKFETIFPWLKSSVEVVGEVLPPLKLAAKALEKFTKITDPRTQGMIACTTAYQQACVEAISQIGKPAVFIAFEKKEAADKAKKLIQEKLAAVEQRDNEVLDDFRLENCEGHKFTETADGGFEAAANYFSYDEKEIRRLKQRVHWRFRVNLRLLLASDEHGRFKNFREFMELGVKPDIRALVRENAEAQVRSFFDSPVLQVEPFALADVCLESDCGIASWDGIKSRALNPFKLERRDLLESVMVKIGNPNFHDVIVIQGAPGAGKSTFTLKLCAELLDQGLWPVRVRMRDFPLDKPLLDAVLTGLEVVDGVRLECANGLDGARLKDLFTERVKVGEAEICPYVFILDAWDELSRSTRQGDGFQVRIDRIMSEIRTTFLAAKVPAVRVVLTGRPSDVIAQSPLLKSETPIHTIQPLRVEQLPEYVERLSRAVQRARFSGPSILTLTLADPSQYDEAWRRYQANKLDVLGLPLLLHLAVRVMADDPARVSNDMTGLYRKLIDQTCEAAKRHDDSDKPELSFLPIDPEFRRDLHQVAIAITTLGGEFISFGELGLRCDEGFFARFKECGTQNPFSRLVIGFFFKAGNPDGMEFLHKSFREYLFAEALVEILRDYGGKCHSPLQERFGGYWREFPDTDLRFEFRSSLAPVLAAQSVTPEIEGHLRALIEWNIAPDGFGAAVDDPRLTIWRHIRDGIADLWDWWGEGVHLRPQPGRPRHGKTEYETPYVVHLVDVAMPQSRNKLDAPHTPFRTTSADSNLGLGLYSLAVALHANVARAEGLGPNERWVTESIAHRRRYQAYVTGSSGRTFVLFNPGREQDPGYFSSYIARIRSAGFGTTSQFPSGRDHRFVVLYGQELDGVDFSDSNLRQAILSRAILGRSSFDSSDLTGADLSKARLNMAEFTGTTLDGAVLREALLFRASLFFATLSGTDLQGCNLDSADLRVALGLTCLQLDSAEGDSLTIVPDGMPRPLHFKDGT